MEKLFHQHEMESAVSFFIENMSVVSCFAFHGEMGAGKTTFITALCRRLGVATTMSSPTFSIINEYATTEGNTIYHMDLYRLKNEEEAIAAGVEDALYSGHICLVEWPEKAPGIFPDNTLYCHITIGKDGQRKLQLFS